MFSYIINRILNLKREFDEDFEELDKNLDIFLHYFLPDGYDSKQFHKGKRVRSILYFYFFRSQKCISNELKYKIIVLLEALHFASLIHDDIVDQNFFRRDTESFFNRFGTKHSLLFGDYLISRIYSEFRKSKFDDFVEVQFFKACSETAYGALLEQGLKIDSPLEEYFKIAYLKTSSIFKLACLLGAYLSGKDFQEVTAASTFGTCFGILFQAQNDLDCYEPQFAIDSEDYQQKNVTFPILILSHCSKLSDVVFQEHNQENYELLQELIKTEEFRMAASKKISKYVTFVERFLNQYPKFDTMSDMT